MLIVGDILFAGQAGNEVKDVYISIGCREGGIAGLAFPDSLWKAGRQLLHATGDDVIDPPLTMLTTAVHTLITPELPCGSSDWTDGACLVNTAALQGQVLGERTDWALRVWSGSRTHK
ncbi:hypothetical protein PC120_g21896 [Phytophthora cactorum]|nr:hypothetical protein PC120_g21896 [Phytophthora cactorum]